MLSLGPQSETQPLMPDTGLPSDYPRYDQHRLAWEELARAIAARAPYVEQEPASAVPGSRPGSLTIIGSGIESIGIAVGDQKILEAADKVLYCIADPATIVWLHKLRPDALDLYVLYGDDKIRYTTYMQMTEAQLHWVRAGLDVVVVFYGHPGVFVLSTHRAVLIARREGHRATMKAGVCALDALCADLGVDPSHPGLQTFEATDCLTRRRRIDPSLHVVLWQVGLIGELGYRRQGYLNQNFSYFVAWLQELYGTDYPITHYIASRYPSIDPLIVVHTLAELHDPQVQETITGLSTFYLAPRDVVPTDYRTIVDLGLLAPGQSLVAPKSPLREIGHYGPREMAAFSAFRQFRIPPSYRWQDDTPASRFLIALRFDLALQSLYRSDPLAALSDPRFADLSDRERALLASRETGAIQIAAKGAHLRSVPTERLVERLLNSKADCSALLRRVRSRPRDAARSALQAWLESEGIDLDWSQFHRSSDFVYRNNLYPWTGVYCDAARGLVITLIGNRKDASRSLLYVNDTRIRRFRLDSGTLRWASRRSGSPHSGFVRFDVSTAGARRLVGKLWADGEAPGEAATFTAAEIDPERAAITALLHDFNMALPGRVPPTELFGDYAMRTSGRFAGEITALNWSGQALRIGGQPVGTHDYNAGVLSWTGGSGDCDSGSLSFLKDPITGGIEVYGTAQSGEPGSVPKGCHGARLNLEPAPVGPAPFAPLVHAVLAGIVAENQPRGGLMLWYKWEKHNFTNQLVSKHLASLI